MKPREEEIVEQLTELCRVNESVHFDISIPALTGEGTGDICFEDVTYSLSTLNLTLHEIEWLTRLEKISIVHKYLFKQLALNEISRTTYSLFVPTKSNIVYEAPMDYKWKPISIISLIGGVLISIMAIVIVANNTNIVGYDTHYGGGYGYHTLTPYGTLCIGIFVILIGVSTLPKKRKK
ncbi:MAG: hypothetical protein ACI956_002210 [Nonlabens sp.]|jgi:hypothetical protein